LKKIIARAAKIAQTDFVKVSSWSAASTVVRMIAGLISTKIAAWTIGPSGMGIVGNFLNSINIVSMLGTGGIGQGVTKMIAEQTADPDKQKKIIAHAVRITLVSTMLVSILVLSFHQFYGRYIFHTDVYNSIIILFGVSIVLYSFNMLFVYIINGFKAYKKYVKVNIAISVASLAVSVLLVLNFGLYGALLSAVASQSVIILVTILFIYREPWFRDIFSKANVDWKIIRSLAGFTAMTVVSTLLVQYAQLSVRTNIASNLSLHDAGIWESMNRISGMYLMVVTTGISTFYLPRLSEISDDVLLRYEILKTMKIVLPALFFACLSIFLARDFIIFVLFNKNFYAVRDLFAFQMIGDFFKIASWLIAFLFWAKAMTKAFIIMETVFSICFILLAKLMINRFGITGSVYAYAINYLLYSVTILFVFRKLLLGARR
jgi:O-antigen/teichoic acid export membrane protein